MLVPVQGGVANLQKRNRTIHQQEAALASIEIPAVYIFNVGPRKWTGIGASKTYTIDPCPSGKDYSGPVVISTLCLSEIDLADGGNNMGVTMNGGLDVAKDVIGVTSTAADLGMHTTNGEWFGIFVTPNQKPSASELAEAHSKLRQMMHLIYSQGLQNIEQKMAENPDPVVRMKERKLYNEAAVYLGYKPLYGDGDAALDTCPECQERIQAGANYCKHCQQPIDAASVAARAKKRAKDAAKLLEEEKTA